MEHERLTAYLNTLEEPLSPDLAAMEIKAISGGVPIIRKDTQALLRFLLLRERPTRILEIGTAVGFSACFMKAVLPDVQIDTIENYEPRLVQAREYLKGTGIRLYEGDVAYVLPTLTGPYDLIFLDGPKGQYPLLLPQLRELLRDEGMLITDNVLQEGMILEARSVIRQRDRTIYDRMREYLAAIKGEGWNSVILPVGDGVAISLKTDRKER